MMTVAVILTVGDELLEGSIVNSNAAWVAEELTQAGAEVRKIVTVGDDFQSIASEIREVVQDEVDLLVLTGGLGPTPDDRTLDGLAEALGRKRTINEEAISMIAESYERFANEGLVRKGGLISSRRKMAELPEGATPIKNPVGGAPAVLVEFEKTTVVCLPGVPREMKAILRENLDRLGIEEPDFDTIRREFEIRGAEESFLAPIYEKLESSFSNLKVRSYPSGVDARSNIVVYLSSVDREKVSNAENFLRSLLENYEGIHVEKINSSQ